LTTVDPDGFELPADNSSLQFPETYIGSSRAERFVSPGGAMPDSRHFYAVSSCLGLKGWDLAGEWTVGKEAAVPQAAGGRIVYRFHARDLNLIMGPAARTRCALGC